MSAGVLRLAQVLAVSLALVACTRQAPTSSPITDGKTASVEASGHPTIVSLNPCSDAILAEVADPAQIRALSAYSGDPDQTSMDVDLARRFPATTGAVESVLAFHPDLVVASIYDDPASIAAMRRLGLRVETVALINTIEEARAQVRDLARLAGHADRGEALVGRIDRSLAAARPPRGTPPISAVLWEPGGIVPGNDTLAAALMAQAGFSNFSALRGMGQSEHLVLERMVADPPRVILAVGSGQGAVPDDDRLLYHPALATLTNTRRVAIDTSLIYCGGPTIPRFLARLVAVRRQLENRP